MVIRNYITKTKTLLTDKNIKYKLLNTKICNFIKR